MTSKERAKLRSLASKEQAIIHVGKGGIGENLIKQTTDALTARELIKGTVLEACELTPMEAAQALAEATGAEVVQTIGSKFVLYKENPEKRVQEQNRAKLIAKLKAKPKAKSIGQWKGQRQVQENPHKPAKGHLRGQFKGRPKKSV